MLRITPLIQERIRTLREVATTADFFFAEELPPYDSNELIPQKGDARMALAALRKSAERFSQTAEFIHDGLDAALRAGAAELKVKDRPDVPADPRRRVRPQGRAAAV